MASGLSEFNRRAELLLSASQQFRDSLGGTQADLESAADDLLEVVPAPNPGRPPPGIDGLAAVLLDLQSGNVLLAAGLRAPDLIEDARRHVASTQTELAIPAAQLGLTARPVASQNQAAAKGTFVAMSDDYLKEIVDGVDDVIKRTAERLAEWGRDKGGELARAIGEAFPIMSAEAGSLIRRGLESIKRTVEALVSWLGPDAVTWIKQELGELWAKLGEARKSVIEQVIGVDAVKQRIKSILEADTLKIQACDQASMALPPSSQQFAREIKLLRAILAGLAVAAGLLNIVFAVPWLALAVGAAYAAVMGAALLIGGKYTGARRLLGHADGVQQIAEAIVVA